MKDFPMNAFKAIASKLVLAALMGLAATPSPAQVVEYIHTDALGSVVAVTDANRTVIERREYEPFGQQLTPTVQNGPGYTGHVQDAATGLTYMQQRYYDPGVGRFLSVDPISAFSSGDWRQFNPYAYAHNDPYGSIDADGRWATYVHQRAIDRVLGPYLSNADLGVLRRSQAIADGAMYQGGDSSFRHSMRSENQSPEQARRETRKFVREQFEKAWSAHTREEALLEFGKALHALQDETSPSHNGFQEWTGEDVIAHALPELLDPGAGSALDQATLGAFQKLMSRGIPSPNSVRAPLLKPGSFKGVYHVRGRLDSIRLNKKTR
jgi:RHS repeat-associated protein